MAEIVMDVNMISSTESLCPECLVRIPAQRVVMGEKVYMVKSCPEHGEFRTLLWRGSPQWDSWVRPTIPTPGTNSWDNLLQQLKTSVFSISGMAFQDVWNVDIDRLKNFCIHVVSPEGKLIPFCAYNLTDKFGHSIYRRER